MRKVRTCIFAFVALKENVSYILFTTASRRYLRAKRISRTPFTPITLNLSLMYSAPPPRFPALDENFVARRDVVVGFGSVFESRDVFVKLAEYSLDDNREAEIQANVRVGEIVEDLRQKNSPIADCLLAATCFLFDVDLRDEGAANDKWISELINLRSNKRVSSRRVWYLAYFVARYVGETTLSAWWKSKKTKDEDRRMVFAQLVLVLEVLAQNGVTHNDLHWGNVLVETAREGETFSFTMGDAEYRCRYRPVVYDWDRAVLDATPLPSNERAYVEALNARFDGHEYPHIAEHHPYFDLLALYKSAAISSVKPDWLIDVCEIIERDVVKKNPSLREFTDYEQISCLRKDGVATSPGAAPETTCESFIANAELAKYFPFGTCEKRWSSVEYTNESVTTLYVSIAKKALKGVDPTSNDGGDKVGGAGGVGGIFETPSASSPSSPSSSPSSSTYATPSSSSSLESGEIAATPRRFALERRERARRLAKEVFAQFYVVIK